jgi:WhiB family redox-sensing transcriptional regulator
LDEAKANCLTADPDIFFVDDPDEEGYSKFATERAKSICSTCEIANECLQVALDNNYDGVWGGFTTKERAIYKYRVKEGLNPLIRKRAKPVIDYIETGREANMRKQVTAAQRDRELLTIALQRFTDLEESTIQMARLRISNPELGLKEIAELTQPRVTKDILAGRLKRLVRRLEREK